MTSFGNSVGDDNVFTSSSSSNNDTAVFYGDHDSGDEDESAGPGNGYGVLLLGLFAVSLTLVLFMPPYLVRRRRLREQLARRAAFSANLRRDVIPGGVDKETRLETIEKWMVSKYVCAHDELCQKVCRLRALDCIPRLRKPTLSTIDFSDAEDDDDGDKSSEDASNDAMDSSFSGVSSSNECPICFESLQVGDIASWSADKTCRHVFHHSCIKEWLLKNTGCPFCRKTFLPIDQPGTQPSSFTTLLDFACENNNGHSLQHCYYCVDHGIVTVPTTTTPRDEHQQIKESDWKSIKERAQSSPDPSILQQNRPPSESHTGDIETGRSDNNADVDIDVAVESSDAPSSSVDSQPDDS